MVGLIAFLAMMNGNISTAGITASPSLTNATFITSAASIVSASSQFICPQCQILPRDAPLSHLVWWNSTLELTLDTVSVLITQYNDTAVTRTTTIYQDVSLLNSSTVTEALSIASNVAGGIDPEYPVDFFRLNNGTSAFVDGSFSVAYPTPFLAAEGFQYISITQQDPDCPPGLQTTYGIYDDLPSTVSGCACAMQYFRVDEPYDYELDTTIVLTSTFYALDGPGPALDGGVLPLTYDGGTRSINNASYSSFIASVLGSESFETYRSCVFLDVVVGPPALMIPMSALTATTTSIIKSFGNYGTPTPKPASSITPTLPLPTSTSTPATAKSVPLVVPQSKSPDVPYVAPETTAPFFPPLVPVQQSPEPAKESPSPAGSAHSPIIGPTIVRPQIPAGTPSDSSGTDQSGDGGDQPAKGSPDSGSQPDVGEPSSYSNSAGSDTESTVIAISYAGSRITPDASSHYSIPQIGNLSPGGSPVSTNNVVYSLAPSATALVSNGRTIPLPTFAFAVTAAPAYQSLQPAEPAVYPQLTFAGTVYTANKASAFSINGQILSPGNIITVSGTPISLVPGASAVVIAGQTKLLSPAAAMIPRPILTVAGSTYTANAASAFDIAGQTLSLGGMVTVSGTPLSLATNGAFAVIAGSTQSLAPAPTGGPPTLTFMGSIYTANPASAFVIQGHTLTPGALITLSGTPISLATDDSFAVIAGSTQSLGASALTPTPTAATQSAFFVTVDRSTFTAVGTPGPESDDFVIDGQTLTRGGVVTVGGTPVRYATHGGADVVVVGTSTEGVVGIGGLILSGFGDAGAGAGATGVVVPFTGGGRRSQGDTDSLLNLFMAAWVLGVGVVVVALGIR